jgi:adenylate cyclase
VRILTLLAAAIANLLGATAVFVLAVWVVPTDEVGDGGASPLVNLILAAGYLTVALPLGFYWALRRLRPGRRWLKEGRAPTAAEQRNLLRAPLHTAVVIGTLWLLAALLFGAFNATYSLELGRRVVITVALGGLVTCAVAYLLTERLLRPAAARALDARALEQPALPGVTARFLFTWAIGSGIPLLGIALIALSALIEKDFSREELAIAALGLSGGAIALGFFAVLLAARVTADPIVSVRRAVGEIERGDLEAEVPVYDGTEVGLLQSGFNRMAEGLRERERIRELFGMHVGEEVARTAMEQGTALGGEAREVAVLFVDVVGSTALAADRPPEEVVALLNDFFGVVIETVDDHGGWVNKFEGDAALAVFGAPEPLDDAAGRALAAGRDLARRLEQGTDGVAAGVGVSYGEVVAGNVGGHERFEYTVIGDAVNEAARLTDLAKDRPGRLLASSAAIEAAGGEEASRWELGEHVELRGRADRTRLAMPVSVPDQTPSGGQAHD